MRFSWPFYQLLRGVEVTHLRQTRKSPNKSNKNRRHREKLYYPQHQKITVVQTKDGFKTVDTLPFLAAWNYQAFIKNPEIETKILTKAVSIELPQSTSPFRDKIMMKNHTAASAFPRTQKGSTPHCISALDMFLLLKLNIHWQQKLPEMLFTSHGHPWKH